MATREPMLIIVHSAAIFPPHALDISGVIVRAVLASFVARSPGKKKALHL